MRKSKRAVARHPFLAPRTARESPLHWLRRRKDKAGRPLLTEPQFQAGERLARDFGQALLQPRVTANWSIAVPAERTRRAAPGAGVEMRDAVAAARLRIDHALQAVGPGLAGLLLDVCCHDIGLEAAEKARAWPLRSAKVVLDLALTTLACHYGLIPPQHPIASRVRHWGDTDYRPSLDEWKS
jgi:Domain of unknown function (DUF6456)